jgi:hypothetical protein
MATNTENPTAPTLLVVEKDGNLAGKRMLTDDYDAAEARAEQIGGQMFALEPVEPAPFAPVVAIHHVRNLDPFTGLPDLGGDAA